MARFRLFAAIAAIVLVGMAVAAGKLNSRPPAEEPQPPKTEEAAAADVEAGEECSVCTARHKSLQALQAVRRNQAESADTAIAPPPAQD